LHIDRIRDRNKELWNISNGKKDAFIEAKIKEDSEGYIRLKKQYSNTTLEEFVTNSNEKQDALIEYDGRIIQKIDPIFLDPEHRMIRAHFYAPRKQVFGVFFDTYWVNVSIMWLMTLVLYLVLYFRLMKKLLDAGELLTTKFSKGE